MLEDARSLRQRLSVSDRQRFEEYLGSVHEIEGRIKRAGQEREAGSWKPSLTAPDRPRPADGIPAEIPDYWKLMNDIVLLAFRTDSTRIATLKYCNDGSILTHAHAGAKDQHHQMAHTQPQELVPVNQFFTSQLAYLCARMEEVKEGDRTLLDNTAIMHCSSMIHGNHDSQTIAGGPARRCRRQAPRRSRERLPRCSEPSHVQSVPQSDGMGRPGTRPLRRFDRAVDGHLIGLSTACERDFVMKMFSAVCVIAVLA